MARILAQAGLRAVDDAGDVVSVRPSAVSEPWHLWPENARVWSIWMRLQTQWRHAGMGGVATGLDYASVWAVLDRSGLRPRRSREAFDCLQGMERAALDVWAEREARSAQR